MKEFQDEEVKVLPYNLQFFAKGAEDVGGETDESEEETGNNDNLGEEDEEPEEKQFSQADMEAAIKKRLTKERARWKKQQTDSAAENEQPKGEESAENPEKKARMEAEEKATTLETKLLCYEQGVSKDAVNDVMALARAYVDDDTDMEDAIDKVLKKYPQFKSDGDKEEGEKKGWGQRHGKSPKKTTTVDDAIKEQLFGK
ncbi:MAG: hypothetical protein RR875_00135 [Clostridium sp.]